MKAAEREFVTLSQNVFEMQQLLDWTFCWAGLDITAV